VKATPAKAKTAAKTPAKTVTTKSHSDKPAGKAPSKTATPAKSVTTSAKRPAAKPSPITDAKPAVAKKAAASAKKMPVKSIETTKTSSPAKSETRVMPPTTVMSASGVPQRTGRPSSRLASLTVPSMAQSVASTAAKASYAPLPDTPVIIPPLASASRKDPQLANNWKTKTASQLTDAELLAMPDAEYMNDLQLAAFRLKLTTLKSEILTSAGETTEHLREDTVVVPDPADRATIEEEHALELRTRDRERKLLKKIEQSISRIDAGDYGYCDETGEPIGVGRLLARPTATLSLEAQQRRELKQKMFGD
jgi:DnaK suppressor protein